MPSDLDPVRTLLIRLVIVLFLFGLLIGILWVDREGLRDYSDGHMSLTDVVYFTMVTVTTVGYGDIVPVTPRARLIDALVVTPVRIFIWVIFLGTAYQLALRQFTEVFRMAKLQSNLDQHVVVCGFGHTGYSAVKELLAKGTDPEHIVVIDPNDERVRTAVELGVVALKGDATQEGLLQHGAFLSGSKAVIISSGRDDTNALILLTVRNLNAQCRVIVSAKRRGKCETLSPRRSTNDYFTGDVWGVYVGCGGGSKILGRLFRRLSDGWRASQYCRANGGRGAMLEKQQTTYSQTSYSECIAMARFYRHGNFKMGNVWSPVM